MKLRRFTVCALAFLLLTLSLPLAAQVTRRDTTTDLNTHKFQPAQDPGAQAQARTETSAAKPGAINPSALQQMNALLLDKKMRNATQRKISSRLLYTEHMMLGLPAAPGVPYLRTDIELDDNNNMYVSIRATVSNHLLQRLRQAGAHIIRSNPAYHSILAFVPAGSLEKIAAFPEVSFISPRPQMATAGQLPPSRAASGKQLASGFEQRAANLRRQLSAALETKPNVGSKQSEGDVTHKAVDTRTAFGIDGTGIKIGVLSDGVSSLSQSQALGDLGPVTVLPGQVGSGDEGTAMLEIIHDLAPGATLYFATANPTIDQFATNIRDLRTAGCDIIVDDVFYFVETPFHDGQLTPSDTLGGVVIQAVNDVTADGAMYFSSAGNEGNVDDGTAGTFQGDFIDGGTNPLLPGGTVSLFGVNQFDTITVDGLALFLFWADPLGGSANDYDLFVLNSAGTAVVDASTDIQDGSQDPVEGVGTDAAGDLAVVFKTTGAADRFFHLNTFRGGLEDFTDGETHGHSHAANAFSVAATPAADPFGPPPNPTGPFPNPFNSTNLTELFSSDGPRQIFFEADGTPITPGNFSSTGGLIRQKPDITAADGVSVTGVGGFPSTFYGTSAAAPHAAAIAGLLKSGKASATTTDIKNAMLSTAIDIEGAGTDRDSGAGIVMAFEAATALGIVPGANPVIGTITAAENPGNGDGSIEAGEGASLTVELSNVGGAMDATNITATLTSTTPGVIVTQPNTSTYPDLAAGSGVATNDTPFAFTLASDSACGVSIDFTLTVTYTGGTSPRALSFSVPTGPPPVSFTTVLDGTAPTPIPGITTATGLQKGRIFRDGSPSACGTPKTFPGYGATTGNRTFDSYSFNACRDSCAQVTLTQTGISLFSAMYSPSFDTTDTGVNYVGDAGLSTTSTSYGVDTTAGNDYTVVVHEVNTGGGLGQQYTVQISSCPLDCTPPNQVPIAIAQNVTVAGDATGFADVSVDNGSSDPDDDPITITQSPASPYPTGTTNVLLTVVDPKGATAQANATVIVFQDFTVPTTLPDATVTAGQTATQTITITPVSSVDTAVTFSCSGLPAHSSCNNPTVTPGANPTDVMLMITTQAASMGSVRSQNAPLYALWLPFGGLGLVTLAGVGNRKRSRKVLLVLALLSLLVGFVVMAGCGSSSHPQRTPGTPTGSYAITVTSTAGLASHTTTFTLNVQ